VGTAARRVVGIEYLSTITALCRRSRLADPERVGWEAADLWGGWRTPRATDRAGQLVFDDDGGEPCAALVTTDFKGRIGLDVLVAPDAPRGVEDAAWAAALGVVRTAAEPMFVTVFDGARVDALIDEGFEHEDDAVDAWMDAAAAPTIRALPEGFELRDRAGDASRPHHLRRRNGEGVAERLAQCSLYRPDLDLFVLAPDGEVCAYGVFWPDLVTGVGLVEPMRTEEPHEHRGIASHVLATGLSRLAATGCARLKVGSDGGLYARAGFVPGGRAATLARAARA
jgi:predicted N-acetyltransferase YhbS